MSDLYCVEQITIPSDLPDILKQWVKAVISKKPDDIFDFSAKYFAKLAGTVPEEDTDTRMDMTTIKQIKTALTALDEEYHNDAVPREAILDVVQAHEFSKTLADRILKLIELNDGVLTGRVFFILLLALASPDLLAAVELSFAAFSQSNDVYKPIISADDLETLFSELHCYDYRVTPLVLGEVRALIEDNDRKPISFGEFLSSNLADMLR
ncbi:flagellar radial spoke protein [Carpediemonas membranifera]|uniref:Flagellar radial spoke protein n=1 Tax=Carpediemonas membranifera TaxID=201153 RepID=A0A8J6DZZ0_9EUKA|nr:flagellar radial spoke protein [Carpediemonas membranifera]|eukprot:KAG9394314.1 flagellar radial spoke protein [Carpediemonas membranifera]